MRCQPFALGQGSKVRAEDGLAGDAQLLGDRGAGDDVVAGNHAHPDVGCLGVLDRVLRLGPRRIDHADHRRHLQVLHQRQQVAVGVELGRVQVPPGGDHDAQTLAAETLHLLVGPLVLLVAPGDTLAVGEGSRGPPDHRRTGALDEGAHDGLPGRVVGVAKTAISLYVGSNGRVASRG